MDEFQRAEKYANLIGQAQTLFLAVLTNWYQIGDRTLLMKEIEQFLIDSEAAFKRGAK